jgi:integrase
MRRLCFPLKKRHKRPRCFTDHSKLAKLACEPGKKQTIYWDAKTPGLGLRVTAAGAKSYIFETWLHGKSLRVTIGNVDTWPIDGPSGNDKTARAEARRLKALTDQDIDPRDQRRDRAAAAALAHQTARQQDLTVREAWQAYIEARKPKWGERHLKNHEYMTKSGGATRTRGRRKDEPQTTQPGPLYPLLTLRLSALDAQAVREWLEPLAAKTPTQAAQTYRALRAFVAWCADRPEYKPLVHADACSRRMARDVLPRAKAKTDCLQREQLEGWFREVRKIGNPVIATYLQALLLTGARREEMARLRWEDVDFKWQSMTIRDKVEGERTIPLTPYLASLLAELKRINDTPPRVRKIRGTEVATPQAVAAFGVGLQQPDGQIRPPSGTAHQPQQGLGRRRPSAADPARPAPFLRHPHRMGGMSRRRGGADHGPQTECDGGKALQGAPPRSVAHVACPHRSLDTGTGRHQVQTQAGGLAGSRRLLNIANCKT